MNISRDRDGGISGGAVIGAGSALLLLIVLVVALGMWGCPKYDVYSREMTGRAELAQATSNRQIKVNEAMASEDSLKGNEDYLRYLWIHNLAEAEKLGAEVIYVPTEANLPILESTRKLQGKKPAAEEEKK
jgi:hypothetical protein